MRKPYIKHENLRKALEEVYFTEQMDESAISRLKDELKHSCLIIAADFTEEGIGFKVLHEKEGKYGVLFSDMDEFYKVFSNGECGCDSMDFGFYHMLVCENVFEGFIFNPASECVIMKRELFLEIDDLPEHEFSGKGAFTADELKNLKASMDNCDLEEFIENPQNLGKYDELFEKMSESTLLTLMLSPDDLREYADDGIISQLETGPLGFLYVDDVGGNYATVYTSESKISNIRTAFNKYSQIVNFSQMANFVLNDDMDGIIINPGDENILLTRDVLLEYYSLLEKICNDSRLNTAIFHMFLIDDEAYA